MDKPYPNIAEKIQEQLDVQVCQRLQTDWIIIESKSILFVALKFMVAKSKKLCFKMMAEMMGKKNQGTSLSA